MKALLVTLIVVIAAVWAIVEFGGVTGFDPEAQMVEFKQKAVPGADWQDLVADVKPQSYRNYYEDSEGFLTTSTSLPYKADLFAKNFNSGAYKDGFILEYLLMAGEAYNLYFDGSGKLTEGEEGLTTQDLLDGTAVEKLQTQ